MDKHPTRPRNEPFSRIAVVNRGEPAVRFLRALRDYNRERGTSFTSVALYTAPDRTAPFLRLADDALALGPALSPAADGTMVSAYTDHERVVESLVAAGCDAVWPGWGFIAEDAALVAKLEARGIQFIGPSSLAMQRLGDKIAAKRLADEAGVPMAAWHVLREGEALEVTIEAARKIGFPLVVKASAGGGGRGIRMVTEARALGAAIKAVHDEVARSFRAGGIFLEACVVAARHIEVQLVVGADGVGAALGIRDCSIQRKHQKVIEEAPSPVVHGALAVELERSAVRLGEIVDYRGVATVEFLVDPARDFAHFLEVNTRLQVEHTITETVMGVDLVHVQLDIARGLPWQRPNASVDAAGSYEPRGHAIEVRLNAEDPERDFQPSPGLVRVFRPPLGPGIRVDSGVAEGVAIAPEFDSMIAKIIAHGRDRRQALARLGRALRELELSVEDGATNKAFLSELIEDPAVVEATADTGWLDRRMAKRTNAAVPGAFEALCVAAIVVRQGALADTVKAFFGDVQSGIPYRFEGTPGPVALSLRGVSAAFDAHCVGSDGQGSRWLVGPRPMSGRAAMALHDARLEPIGGAGAGSAILHLSDGLRTTRHAVLTSVGRTGIAVEVDGRSHLVELTGGGQVKAPAPALVVAVHVAIGAEVEVGTRLCTLEAMKMEVPVLAREAGVVRQIGCRPNEQVQAGQALFEIESATRAPRIAMSSEAPRPVVRALTWLFPDGKPDPTALQALPESEATRAIAELCQVLRWALVGWDVPEAFVARVEELLACEDAFRRVAQPHLFRPLADVLGAFSDVEQVFAQDLALDSGLRSIAGKVAFFEVCRTLASRNAATASDELVASYTPRLLKVLAHHGVSSLTPDAQLSEALWRLARANAQSDVRQRLANQLLRALMALNEAGLELGDMRELELFLARTAEVARPELPALRDNARQARYVMFRRKRLIGRNTPTFAQHLADQSGDAMAMLRELYGSDASITPRALDRFEVIGHGGAPTAVVLVADALPPDIAAPEVHVLLLGRSDAARVEHFEAALPRIKASRVAFTWTDDGERELHRVYDDGARDALLSDVHPEHARRLELWRLAHFDLQRIPAPDRIVALRARAKANPKDERIIVMAEVQRVPASLADGRGSAPLADSRGQPSGPSADQPDRSDDAAGQRELEWAFAESLRILREAQAQRDASQRYFLNRIVLHVGPVLNATQETLMQVARRLEGATRGHGLQKVVVQAKVVRDGQVVQRVFTFATRGRHRLEVHEKIPSDAPVRAASDLHLRSERARRLGTIYPYEMVRSLEGTPDVGVVATAHPDMVHGRFVEHDLDADGVLVPVSRPHGHNQAGVVVGLMTHVTRKHPEGMTRVWLASDSTTAMGALAEPECRRVLAAIALATELRVPIEWLPISSGAKIAMDSGTENLDWTARVLAAIIAFTQRGGEINVIVAGVNVGAQSYWNAEATMLMHTRGVLIQTGDGSMVLTGKRALEVSGSVAAEDERGIGGYERIMGPNGQAQFFAKSIGDAYRILFEHYAFSYVVPGERGPRRLPSIDPPTRSILDSELSASEGMTRVGQIRDLFSDASNPGRKKPFAIREVMRAAIDDDGGRLERFADLEGGETAAVWDAHMGGHAITLIGFESKNLARRDKAPLDGPDRWSGGTLFPQSSKKVARAINQASGTKPVVVLANLSGFDGSPESMRKLQLEYGAEIGRAVVNFDGPIVFVVIGRYHGGAYVVFSKALNPRLTAFAVEGAFASVIGGAPAAAVVFPREVRNRANKDPRIVALRAALAASEGDARDEAEAALERALADVILEHQGVLAREFDAIHSVERAVRVGSLDAVIAPAHLRERVIAVLDAARASRS